MKTIEIFCGAGLVGEGLSRAGFETIIAIDSY